MDRHYSYACDDCIARFIGPALDRVLRDATVDERDACYGCGKHNVNVRYFAYWYPYPDSEV